jgi:hypothetical protein
MTGPKSEAVPHVRIPRSFFEGFMWNEKRVFSRAEAYQDILVSARYSDAPKQQIIGGKMITWGRGQMAASIRFLAKRWMWSKDKVSRFLEILVKQDMILVATNQQWTVLTILTEKTGHQTGHQQGQPNTIPASVSSISPDTNKDSIPDTDGTVTRTKQKECSNNEVKKNTEIEYAFASLEFRKTFDEWIVYRKEIKKPLTDTSIKKQMEVLKKEKEENAIEILNQSMEHGWIGFQPLKTNRAGFPGISKNGYHEQTSPSLKD